MTLAVPETAETDEREGTNWIQKRPHAWKGGSKPERAV